MPLLVEAGAWVRLESMGYTHSERNNLCRAGDNAGCCPGTRYPNTGYQMPRFA